jgi:hypothetical protein
MKRPKNRLQLNREAIRALRTLDDLQLPQAAGGHVHGPGGSGRSGCMPVPSGG